MTKTTRTDVYQQATDKIIAQLEQGIRPWSRPWETGGMSVFPLRSTGERYKGINVLMLWSEAAEKGYTSPYWFTFKQARAFGSCVRKGERSTLVFYAGAIERTEEGENGEDVEKRIPFMKSYCVFNACQIDDLPPEFFPKQSDADLDDSQRIAHADEFFRNTRAEIRHGGNAAFYNLTGDYVQMPEFATFKSPEAYAGVLAHELAHWTGHTKRLARDFKGNRFGNEGYAREELVAEISSCFLGIDLGIEVEPREDHAAYLASWLKVLADDKRAIFQAAALAQKACDYMHDLQPLEQQTVDKNAA